MRSIIQKDDYVGFTYANIHTSQLGIKSVTNGDRYQRYLSPESNDLTSTIVGSDLTYYFGNNKTKKTFNFNVAFDDMTESEYNELRRWLNSDIKELILDETPYIKYFAKISSLALISFLVFMDEDGKRIYKGELGLSFVCYNPYGHIVHKWIDEYLKEGYNANGQTVLNKYSNITEWSEGSKLLMRPRYYDRNTKTYIDIDTILTDDNKTYMNIYNPGDIPTNFKIDIDNISNSGNFKIEVHLLLNEVEKGKFIYETSEHITNFHIDSEKRLAYYIKDNEMVPCNSFLAEGNLFKIPTNEINTHSKLELTVTGVDLTDENFSFKYDYLYL